jgi:transglutaminase-like putative cysteine protease
VDHRGRRLPRGPGRVCRGYAHLAITFCRALNIPARYVFGYIPDIGVVDVALITSFGPLTLTGFEVHAQQVTGSPAAP